MAAPKHSSKLYALLQFEPEYHYLVRCAADRTNMKQATAFELLKNLITAYEVLIDARRRFYADKEPILICQQSKSVM